MINICRRHQYLPVIYWRGGFRVGRRMRMPSFCKFEYLFCHKNYLLKMSNLNAPSFTKPLDPPLILKSFFPSRSFVWHNMDGFQLRAMLFPFQYLAKVSARPVYRRTLKDCAIITGCKMTHLWDTFSAHSSVILPLFDSIFILNVTGADNVMLRRWSGFKTWASTGYFEWRQTYTASYIHSSKISV